MSVSETIKARRSIRAYQNKSLSGELVDKLSEALLWAPSAGNLQSRKFYFVYNNTIKQALAQATHGQNFILQAPLVIVGCADIAKVEPRYGLRGTSLFALQDVAASIQNLMLVAQENGLGTVWIGAFDEDRAAKALKLPNYLRPVIIVPVGYSAQKPMAPPRVSQQEAIEIIE